MTIKNLLFGTPNQRIKNLPRRTLPTDFRFSTFSFLVLAVITGAAFASLQIAGMPASDIELQGTAAALLVASLLLVLLPTWGMLVIAILAAWLTQFYLTESYDPIIYGIPTLALLPAAMLQLLQHWDKGIILRVGRFHRVRGAGLSLLIPFADRIAARVDTRIRVTDFSAERTLSRDNIPVHIDAICFWMIWDARKAILEVQDFMDAVTLSAQTALRDAIGTNDLSTLLSEREQIGRDLQRILDAKTDPWGITVLSVEFTDIIIPKELEDAMSKHAQADREHKARLILGETEVQLADRMSEAAARYRDNPEAFQLRSMSMMYDGLRQSKGSMVLVPTNAAEQLQQPLGITALQRHLAPNQDATGNQGETK
ncbi:slipin family protein [Spirochaeta africana]|uniref:Membrane protease subunit, stomatin/prohibitin n=1 Tax=Spirochaeta africana (strain ATCC 700263 / DSM 8902 / Z-7692) TaxID=889378 RepID=H9UFJ0_SPIAZ|nr:slipin family protein [Spirochaeta africana]AFG36283.1 membrane protease subunit, stomatin/prohibitin [Spirochaeta africana DSM 8902]